MEPAQIQSKVRQFLGKLCRVDALGDGDDIFGRGLVNSLHAMQIIMFLEKTFGLQVGDADLDLANFRTIEAIRAFVLRKQTGSPN